jgi:hypothetical protein
VIAVNSCCARIYSPDRNPNDAEYELFVVVVVVVVVVLV